MRNDVNHSGGVVRLGVVLLVWLGLVLAGVVLVTQAPSWQYLAQLTITPGESADKPYHAVLGYAELGQHAGPGSADAQHLTLDYQPLPALQGVDSQSGSGNTSASSQWRIGNRSVNKSLLYKYAEVEAERHYRLHHWPLQAGDQVQIDTVRVLVREASTTDGKLVLECVDNCEQNGQQAEWQPPSWLSSLLGWGGSLQVSGSDNYKGCGDALGTRRLFYVGGQVACPQRWKMKGIPTKTAAVEQYLDQFWWVPLRTDVAIKVIPAAEASQEAATPIFIQQQTRSLKSQQGTINELLIGSSQYNVTERSAAAVDGTTKTSPAVLLGAKSNIHLFAANALPKADSQHNEQWEPWQWGALFPTSFESGLGGMMVILLTGFGALVSLVVTWLSPAMPTSSGRFRHRLQSLLVFLPVVLLWLALVRGEHLPWLATLVALSALSATLLLMWRGYLKTTVGVVAWILLLLLAGSGYLVQLQLALGADNTSWHKFAERHSLAYLGVFWGVALVAFLPPRFWQLLVTRESGGIRFWPWVIFVLVTSVVALVLLGLGGSESGVAGFQPAELAKSLMAFMLALAVVTWLDIRLNFRHTLAQLKSYQARQWWRSAYGRMLWRIVFGVVVMVLLSAVILGSVRDFSPILILGLLVLAFVLAFMKMLPKVWRWVVSAAIAGVVLMLCAALVYPEQMASWLPQGERLLIWDNPWAYPDFGLQAQQSLKAVEQGGVFGRWDAMNEWIMRLPALQDDFILAFVLLQTGAVGGLLLLVTQLGWLGLLFGLHQRLVAIPQEGVAQRNRWLSVQLLAWWLYGLAWLQLAHWLISWGNVLGLLPIMGQPMTWLSAGNSHLLALGLPQIILLVWGVGYLLANDQKERQ